MKSDNRELKALSLRFRDLVSRAMRSGDSDARVNLRRLLAFVNATPLLKAEIERAPSPTEDVREMWDKARNSRDRLVMPDDPMEELGLLHAVISELARENGEMDFRQMCFFYGGVSRLQESIEAVLHDTVGRYEGHLRQVIEMALLDSNDPAYDSRRIDIHVSGGTNQLNVAQDQARLQAQMNVSPEAVEALHLARELVAAAAKARLDGMAEAEEVEEVATAVVEQLESSKPSRFTLRSAKEKLENLAGVTTITGTLATQAGEVASVVKALLEHFPK